MVTTTAVRRMVAALPGAKDASSAQRLVFEAPGGKGFAWTFMRRVDPKKARAPDLKVLAVRCAFESKTLLIEAAPDVYFDDDHYRGYPALLVRLEVVDAKELKALLKNACAIVVEKGAKKRVAKKKAPAKRVSKR